MFNEYSVFWSDDIVELCALINRSFKYGWQPLGGVTITQRQDGYEKRYHQAMGRFVEKVERRDEDWNGV